MILSQFPHQLVRSSLILRKSAALACIVQERGMAARKGTRIRRMMENKKRARLRALEALNAPPKVWMPAKLRMLLEKNVMKQGMWKNREDDLLPLPPDDVFFTEKFKTITYNIDEIVQALRESHGETMLDEPDAIIEVVVEVDCRHKKKNKFLDSFEGMADLKQPINLGGNRYIAVIAKSLEDQEKARQAGAVAVGGLEIIKDLQKGVLKPGQDFDHLVVHSDVLIDLASARGILKTHFPSKQKGNFGTDITALVAKFLNGIDYHLEKDKFDNTHGHVTVPFARLNMDIPAIEENLAIALNQVETHRPRDVKHDFIATVDIKSHNKLSREKFRLKHWLIKGLDKVYKDANAIEENGEDDEAEAQRAK